MTKKLNSINPFTPSKVTLFVELPALQLQLLQRLAIDKKVTMDELLSRAIDCYFKQDPED